MGGSENVARRCLGKVDEASHKESLYKFEFGQLASIADSDAPQFSAFDFSRGLFFIFAVAPKPRSVTQGQSKHVADVPQGHKPLVLALMRRLQTPHNSLVSLDVSTSSFFTLAPPFAGPSTEHVARGYALARSGEPAYRRRSRE